MTTMGHLIGMILGYGLFVGGPCYLVSIVGFRLAKGRWLPWRKILVSVSIVIIVSGVAYAVLGPYIPYGGASLLILVVIPLLVSLITIRFFYVSVERVSGVLDDAG